MVQRCSKVPDNRGRDTWEMSAALATISSFRIYVIKWVFTGRIVCGSLTSVAD